VIRVGCGGRRCFIGGHQIVKKIKRNPYYIINFPTKQHWRHPSKPEYIRAGLEDLMVQIQRLNLHSIAIPALGVGLGGLEWTVVKPLILEAFVSLPEVRVLLFEPQQEIAVPRENPEITLGKV
jgi:O-acetyl-ADP-ribose deacetylase (regulator of RNase III)